MPVRIVMNGSPMSVHLNHTIFTFARQNTVSLKQERTKLLDSLSVPYCPRMMPDVVGEKAKSQADQYEWHYIHDYGRRIKNQWCCKNQND
jgi:hypothetical protein